MPRRKSSKLDAATVPDVDQLCHNLVQTLNALGGGGKAYLYGDHMLHTAGISIPSIAFQWLIGGVDVLPVQRCVGISGLPKSFKSTLNIEIGNWFIAQNGVHVVLDTESKTSATMLAAMVRHDPKLHEWAAKRRLFKEATSIERWQEQVLASLKFAKTVADRPAGSRIPIYISIDSLNGRSSESSQARLMKEGFVEDRGFPVDAMKITRFFKSLSLSGTLATIGYVQHLVQDLSAAQTYGGPVMKESGAVIAAYQSSIHIRVSKGRALQTKATHPSAPRPDVPVDGYTLWLTAERSCLGPDRRTISVDVLWQYVDEDGQPVQYMWYDWDGALGRLLIDLKYGDRLVKHERDALEQALVFTQVKSQRVSCDELGLDHATPTEFGRAIASHPDVAARIKRFLGISSYPTVQHADVASLLAESSLSDDEDEDVDDV